TIHSFDLGDLQDFSAFILQPSQMYEKIKTGSNLPADHRDRKLYSHEDHGFQSADHIPTGIGMDARQASIIAYIYSLKKLGGFLGTDFPYNDPAGTHTKTGFKKISNGYFLGFFYICLSAFQPYQIGNSLELQFSIVFNSDYPLIFGDIL